jgi:hypothetical protein
MKIVSEINIIIIIIIIKLVFNFWWPSLCTILYIHASNYVCMFKIYLKNKLVTTNNKIRYFSTQVENIPSATCCISFDIEAEYNFS